MVFAFIWVIAGFVALILGANWLVNGASALARKYKVSDLVIGLTIVAFGTSAPELVVNSIAATQGYSDIVLGNIIGSNNFNLFIILGLSGLIYPIQVQSSTAWKEIPIALFTSVLLWGLLTDFEFSGHGMASRIDGFVMLGLFGAFLYYVFHQMKKDKQQESTSPIMPSLKIYGLIVLGMVGLVVGGQLVVVYSVEIASALGVSEKIIGLTIVAAGTSLPELVTSVVAALKKNSDIAIGNVIGSNIFNILLILAISSIIQPIGYHARFNLDLFVLIGGTVFLFLSMFIGHRKRIGRWESALLFGFYSVYITGLVIKEL